MPGNPWPHDMMITIEDDLQQVLELLWIREAWMLEPEGPDLPPLLVDTPAPLDASVRAAAPVEAWRETWPRVWRAVVAHTGNVRDADILERLQQSADRSDERARLLLELIGPSWQDALGAAAGPDDLQQWMHAQFERRASRRPVTLEEQPERAALDALIPAWRCGLTKIVEIPCGGSHTRRIGEHTLLVTAGTRADTARYAEALASFC
ncbi:MAG: hypothetical protein AAGC66_11150 [Leifsonia sp.]